MLSYQLWRMHQVVNEVNKIIANVNKSLIAECRRNHFWETAINPVTKLSRAEAEAQLPKLGYLFKRQDGERGAQWFIEEERKKNQDPNFNAEKSGIRQCLIVAFKEENTKQRGGIKFPPGVIVNKINHRVFNYDEIQDKITALISGGQLDCCSALDIRFALKDKMFKLGEHIINMIKFPLKLGGEIMVDKTNVERTHQRFYQRDISELRAEKMKANCGDCGGARSSAKKFPTPQLPPPQKNFNRKFAFKRY